MLISKKRFPKFYGISKDPISYDIILVFDEDYDQNLCFKCQYLLNFFDLCERCKLNHFQLNYGEFPSGNNEIDNILKDDYCKSKSPEELIEWISYNDLKDISSIKRDIYYQANWIKGHIIKWNFNKNQWKRVENQKVVLKIIDDLSKIKV